MQYVGFLFKSWSVRSSTTVTMLQYVVRDATSKELISVERRPTIALSAIQDALDASASLDARYSTALGDKPMFRLNALLQVALQKPVLTQDMAAFEQQVASIVRSQQGN